MSENIQIYHHLLKEINERMPIGFPKTNEGIEIEILKQIFTPEEAKIAIHLSTLPEPLKIIHKRIDKNGISISIGDLKAILDRLVEKGAILDGMHFNNNLIGSEKRGEKYGLAQFAIGIYEFQVDKLTRRMAELSEAYLRKGFYKEFHRKDRPTQMRTIPVDKSLVPEYHVSTYDNIREILNNKVDRIAIINCVCRQTHDLIDDKCKLSEMRRVCVIFNKFADYNVETGHGEYISKEELLKMLNDFQKAGFVLQPENSKNPAFLCICCGCCCGVLTSAKLFPKPAEYYSSNYYAIIQPETCNGCEICMKRCQMDAIAIINKKAKVNLDRCIGCGNCVVTCPMKAIKLKKKNHIKVPPNDQLALYSEIIMKKRGLFGSLKMVGNYLFNKKA